MDDRIEKRTVANKLRSLFSRDTIQNLSGKKVIWLALSSLIFILSILFLVFPNLLIPPTGPSPTPTPTPIDWHGQPVTVDEPVFSMRAEIADSIGVTLTTPFLITSKEALPLNQVRNSLSAQPEFNYQLSQINDTTVKLIPSQTLTPDTIYRFHLTNGFAKSGESCQWAFQTKKTFKVTSSLPRDKVGNVPIDTGLEITFSHENYQDPSLFFGVTPTVEGSFERHKKTAVFVPKKLEYATIYTVTISKELGLAESNETLASNYTFQFETQAPPTPTPKDTVYNFDFAKQFVEVPSFEEPALGIYAYELPNDLELTFEIYRFPTQESFIEELKQRKKVPLWASASWTKYLTSTDNLEHISTFTSPIQKGENQGYIIFPEKISYGYYLVQGIHEQTVKQVLMQVTDLSSYIGTSKTKTIIWVHHLSSKKPFGNATVTLIGENYQTTTNEQGIAYFDTPAVIKEESKAQYFLISGNDGERLALPANQAYYGNYGRFFTDYEAPWYYYSQANDNYWAYLYFDRDLYQPTDTIYFWGLIKHRDQPANRPEVKVALEPSGNNQVSTVQEKVLSPSDFGTFNGNLSFTNLKAGDYQVVLSVEGETISSNWINIKAYTKPAYKISVTPGTKAVFAGDPVTLNGEVAFYEGSPVPQVTLKYSGSIEGEVTSDDKGQFQIPYTPGYETDSYISYPRTKYIEFVPKVSEEGEITGSTFVSVFGPKVYLSAQREYLTNNQAKVTITANEINLEGINQGTTTEYLGEPIANQKITGTLSRKWWEKKESGEYYDFINKKVRKRYTYSSHSEVIDNISLTSDNNGDATYQFTMAEKELYELQFTATDERERVTKQTVYCYGHEYYYGRSGSSVNSPSSSGYYHLVLRGNDNKYSLDEQVLADFQDGEELLPEQKDQHYLFLLDQRGLSQYQLQTTPSFEFTMAPQYIPNVYLRGIYFNGRTYQTSSSTNVIYRSSDKELDITVQPVKLQYQPTEEVELNVEVKDQEGKGQAAEVNVSLVDEAFFALKKQYVTFLDDLYTQISSGILQTYSSHQYPVDKVSAEYGGGCFLQGTPVKLANGSYQPIDQITVGDNIQTLTSPGSKISTSDQVIRVDKHKVQHLLVINHDLQVTPEHRLFINGVWKPIGLAEPGDFLLDENGDSVMITSIEQKYGQFNVYNLQIKDHKTYLAGGFYVHNEKGLVRENFADNAFFGITQTDSQGHGTFKFKLPDNLTSWRITYHGITQDLKANHGTNNLIVRLPFFIELSISNEYLLKDKPKIKLRAYGDTLQKGQEVKYSISIPSLGVTEPQSVTGSAFETVEYTLPVLQEGEHRLIVQAKAGNYSDAVARTFRVISSRLARTEAIYTQLTEDTIVDNPHQDSVSLIFSDDNRGRYYPPLNQLSWAWGDRVDQRLTRVKGTQLLNQYFETNRSIPDFNPSLYQAPNGGITLLPYSSSEIDLSAKVSALAGNEFDSTALKNYFWAITENRTSNINETISALYGLASLDEPVLVMLQQLSTQSDLTTTEKLYLALGLTEAGDYQNAHAIYRQVVESCGEESGPYLRLNTGSDQDDILTATTIAAQIAQAFNDTKSEKLFKYIDDHRTKDILTNLEKLSYLTNSLPSANPEPVSFTYSVNNVTETKNLELGRSWQLNLNSTEAESITFSEVSDNVGLSIVRQTAVDSTTIDKSPYAAVNRTFLVNDQPVKMVAESDLVKVKITYKLANKAYGGCYQVTDFLPSGLRPITKLSSWGISQSDQLEVTYPYETVGQRINFCTYRNSQQNPLVYYARVISKGEYVGEPVLIQSQNALDDLNLGTETSIIIE